MFVAILVFIVILGVLVFVHELGHFVTARRNGVRAPEFGFGFPPRMVGIQFIRGKKKEKFVEMESVETEKIDVKSGDEEIIQEIRTEKFHNAEKTVPVGKWRIIWGGKDGDDENEKTDLAEAHENHFSGGTIYSLNWIPLGGFVKIKGEDGGSRDEADSFSGKSAWVRIKILAAGVVMNFVLAWFLLSVGFIIGAPEQTDSGAGNNPNTKIQISEIIAGAPGSVMGLKVGDEISKLQKNSAGEIISLQNVKAVQEYVNSNKGRAITLEILRGKEKLFLTGTPRVDAPQNQGALGIALAETALVRYPWHIAIWKGAVAVWDMTVMIFAGLFGLLHSLFVGRGMAADVSGPVGIAILTKEVTNLGLVYIIQFAAILSINLGIINILPIPALDGGRILFVLIEKIKGSPVSQKVEQIFHTFFFALLMLLMVAVTYKDIARLF